MEKVTSTKIMVLLSFLDHGALIESNLPFPEESIANGNMSVLVLFKLLGMFLWISNIS